MDDAGQTVVLPDGRRLGYATYGAPDGTPAIYCHGFPGSRIEASLADAAARQRGVRVIAPDRPGFGISSLHPDRLIGDWPSDVAHLCDALGIDRCHLIGVSGGTPYALACGEHLAGRVRRISIVCGLGELHGTASRGQMNTAAASGIRFYQAAPRIAHRAYADLVGPLLGRHPEWLMKVLVRVAGPSDRAVLKDPWVHSTLARSYAEAFHGGGEGPALELRLLTRPWGIDLRRVPVPVQLWHGDDDRTVPIEMGRRHAALLPRCQARFLPGEGHFSLVVRHLDEILAGLVADPKETD